jgi:hypothetical protein
MVESLQANADILCFHCPFTDEKEPKTLNKQTARSSRGESGGVA